MNSRSAIRLGLATSALCAAVVSLAGCELLVDFDRSKIPVPDSGDDSALGDGSLGDDGGALEATTSDAEAGLASDAGDAGLARDVTSDGSDGGIAALSEASIGVEGGEAGVTDSSIEAQADAPVEAGQDATEQTDAAEEAGQDATLQADAPEEAGQDATQDGALDAAGDDESADAQSD